MKGKDTRTARLIGLQTLSPRRLTSQAVTDPGTMRCPCRSARYHDETQDRGGFGRFVERLMACEAENVPHSRKKLSLIGPKSARESAHREVLLRRDDMPVDDLASFAPWLIAGTIWAIAFFLMLNHALAAVGLDGFTAGHEGGPVDAAPDGTDALYEHFYRQLVALGMRPAGITWEKIVA